MRRAGVLTPGPAAVSLIQSLAPLLCDRPTRHWVQPRRSVGFHFRIVDEVSAVLEQDLLEPDSDETPQRTRVMKGTTTMGMRAASVI